MLLGSVQPFGVLPARRRSATGKRVRAGSTESGSECSGKDIDEPEYRCWTAFDGLAFQRIANAQEDAGDLTGAVASLAERIDFWRALYRELSNADRRDDLEKALTS